MTIPLITAYPGDVPDKGTQTQAVFTANTISWLTFQIPFIGEVNTTVAAINTDTAQVTLDKAAAAASAAAAKASEDNAANTANQKGNWSGLTGAATMPFAVYHKGTAWVLLNALADITTSEPGVTGDWSATSERFSFVSAAFTIANNCNCSIDASVAAVDAAFLTSYAAGTVLTIHNESISTNLVRLTNTALTIRGKKDNLTTADNLVLKAGETVKIAMKTTTEGVFL